MTSMLIAVTSGGASRFRKGDIVDGTWAPNARGSRWTRWWRPRWIVTRVDPEHGEIRVVEQYWSWRRWRWLP